MSREKFQLDRALHAQLGAEQFLSPVSLQIALALIGSGATGQTRTELEQIISSDTLALASRLRSATEQGEPVLRVANAVFAKISVKPEYAAYLRQMYDAEFLPLTTASAVNEFVSKATDGIIKQIVSEGQVKSTQLIAVNAIYFKGKWATPFLKHKTLLAPFNTPEGTTPCKLMESPLTNFAYYEDEFAQHVLLPYQQSPGSNSNMTALVVLPKAMSSVSVMATTDVKSVVSKLRAQPKTEGQIYLPKFKAESSNSLTAPLIAIGIRTAFTPVAQFPHISNDPLMISDVVQKVMVTVDEEGTVAAAATAVTLTFDCARAPRSPFVMRCDRPFGFAILLPDVDVPLFSGTVVNPVAPEGEGSLLSDPSSVGNPFRFKLLKTDPPSLSGEWANPRPSSPSPISIAERELQKVLFTPACRRDVYRVLCMAPPAQPSVQRSDPLARTPPLKWTFIEASQTFQTRASNPATMTPADEATLCAIESIGLTTTVGLAVTVAFENLLTEIYVPFWTDQHVAGFSIAFITAFGMELGPSLDITHAIRARQLSETDIAWLLSLPPSLMGHLRGLLAVFQG
eukprot:Colp12_sorted_trinity150504_noHs@8410